MPLLASPPPQNVYASMLTRLGREAELTISQPYTERLEAALGELRRSYFWPMKARFEESRVRLKRTSTLENGWDSYGADAPNDEARALASQVLDLLEAHLRAPARLMPSAEGGIALAFVDGENRAGIEIYNTGEIAAATWSGQDVPVVWDIDNSERALKNAIEQIRVRLAA